jgi:hypothetical protein
MSIYSDRLIHRVSKPNLYLKAHSYDPDVEGLMINAIIGGVNVPLNIKGQRYWNIEWNFERKSVQHESFPQGKRTLNTFGYQAQFDINCPKLTKLEFQKLLTMYNLAYDIGVNKKLYFSVHGGNVGMPPADLEIHLPDDLITFDVIFDNDSFKMEYPNNNHIWHSASFRLVSREYLDTIPIIYYTEEDDD